MQRKTIAALLCGAFVLSGCGSIRSMLETKILDESGLADDPDYQRYMSLLEQELLDETGIYTEKEPEGTEPSDSEGRIHVTFADHARIRSRFYKDESRSYPLTSIDIDPGEKIYIDVPVASHPLTDLYSADGFRLVSYDSEYKPIYSEVVYPEGDGSYITIPEDCYQSELTVQPLGKYENRHVYISDYIFDEEGRRHEQSGEWIANDETFTAVSAEIPSSEDLDLEFHYDPDVYRLILTEPEALALDEENGIAYFAHEDALSETDRYEAELQKYLNVSLNGRPEGILHAKVNGNPAWISDSVLRKLNRTDQIVITVKDEYILSGKELKQTAEPEKTEEGMQYTFEVPEDAPGDLCILIRKQDDSFQSLAIHHGELTLTRADGTAIEEEETIPEDTEVTVKITPEEGYYISGSDVENNVFEKTLPYAEFLEKADALIDEHKILKYVTVSLEEEGEHGTAAYSFNKEAVSGTVEGLKIGDTIKAEYTLTDKAWKFDQESNDVLTNITELIQSVIFRNKRTVYIHINAEMDGETLNGEDYTEIRKRGQ